MYYYELVFILIWSSVKKCNVSFISELLLRLGTLIYCTVMSKSHNTSNSPSLSCSAFIRVHLVYRPRGGQIRSILVDMAWTTASVLVQPLRYSLMRPTLLTNVVSTWQVHYDTQCNLFWYGRSKFKFKLF